MKYCILILCLISFSGAFTQSKSLVRLETSLRSQHDTSLVNTLNQLSWAYRHIDSKKAMAYGNRAEQLSRRLNYSKGLAYAYKNLGAICSFRGEYPKARTYYNKSLQQFKELRNQPETGNIYNLYGLLYWETGKYDSALINYDLALKFYKRAGDYEGITIVYSNSGIIYYETGKLEKALSRYARALEIAEKRNDTRTLASIHTNIGLVYNQLGNYAKALHHQKASLVFETEQQNLSGAAKSYTNIGVTYHHLKQADSSLVYHKKALRIYRQVEEKKGISQSLVNIGIIYMEDGEFQKANDHFLPALSIKREIDDALGEVTVLTHLGLLREKEGNTTESVAYLDTAYRKAHTLGSLLYQVKTSKALAELHEELGHNTKSMFYYKIYTAANERYLLEKSNTKLTNTLVGMATKHKQRQITKLEKKVTTAAGFVVLVGVISLVAGFSIRKQRREKQRLKTQLEAHTEALMKFTRELVTRNAELSELQAQMAEVSQESPITTTEAFKGTTPLLTPERVETLNKLSTSRIVTDEDWETFKQLFTQVHPDYMLRMKELYPGITQAELRLSALITLQLSSKEIAAILGISLESVKKARQRLRKKMELNAEQDLDEVLRGIC